MSQSQPGQQPQQNQIGPEHHFKGSPDSDPGQALESGEPTLTGDATEDATKPAKKSAEPDEGAHWESGHHQA